MIPMAGQNAHQKVSDQTYEDLLSKVKKSLIVQRSDYYHNKLKGKKYLFIENDEQPGKPRKRYRIESIKEGTGTVTEDIYGTTVTGPHLEIQLKLREKTQ